MLICPNCGAPTGADSALRVTSKKISRLNEDHKVKCFCRLNLNAASVMYNRLESKLEDLLKKIFPGLNKKRIKEYILRLPSDMPLRAELVERYRYLERLKEKIEILKENQPKPIEAKPEEKLEQKPARGLSAWLKEMGEE